MTGADAISTWTGLLLAEHPQTAVLALDRLPAELSCGVLLLLPENFRMECAMRLNRLGDVGESIERLAAGTLLHAAGDADGVEWVRPARRREWGESLARILAEAPEARREEVLEPLRERNREASERVRARLSAPFSEDGTRFPPVPPLLEPAEDEVREIPGKRLPALEAAMADCARSVAQAASEFVGGAELDDSMVFSSLKAAPPRPVLQTRAEENPAPYARLRPGPCGVAMDAAADGSLLYSLLGVALGDRGGFPLGISGRTCSLVEIVFFRAFAEAVAAGVADAFSRLLPSPLFCALAEEGGASGIGGDTTLRMTLTVGSGGGTLFLRVPHAWMGPAALDLAKSRL